MVLGQDLLEKHFLESWKKEASSEEDAARSITSAITTLSISAAILGFQKDFYIKMPIDIGALFLLATMVVYLACASIALERIYEAIRVRKYATLPNEKAVLEFARAEAKRLEEEEELEGVALETRFNDQLARHYLDAYAEVILHNRPINAARLRARTEALFYSMGALVASFASLAYLVIRTLPAEV